MIVPKIKLFIKRHKRIIIMSSSALATVAVVAAFLVFKKDPLIERQPVAIESDSVRLSKALILYEYYGKEQHEWLSISDQGKADLYGDSMRMTRKLIHEIQSVMPPKPF